MNLVKLLESLDGMSNTEQVDECYNGADEEVTVGVTTNLPGERGTVNPPTKTPALMRMSREQQVVCRDRCDVEEQQQ